VGKSSRVVFRDRESRKEHRNRGRLRILMGWNGKPKTYQKEKARGGAEWGQIKKKFEVMGTSTWQEKSFGQSKVKRRCGKDERHL